MSWPLTEPSWLETWALWRARGGTLPRPQALPTTIPRWAWDFLAWYRWRASGGLPADRPPLPESIPVWAWSAYKRLHAALNPVDPFAALQLPVLYTSEPGSGVEYAQRAKAAGFRSLAVQNVNVTDQDFQAIAAAGLGFHLWGIAGADDARLSIGGCYVPQIEGPEQRDAALEQLEASPLPLARRGIVTNFGGSPIAASAFTSTAVECYAVENPDGPFADLARMTWQARQLGLPLPYPLVECIRGVGLELYPQLATWGPNFGVWRAEQVPEQLWAQVLAQVQRGIVGPS